MTGLRENLTTLLNKSDRPIIEQVAIELCQFAYGPDGCTCAKNSTPICASVKIRAEYVHYLVEKDVNSKAKAKRQATKEKAAATRSRKKLVRQLGVNDG